MYAIIEDSGTQFKVQEGDVLQVDLRDVDTAEAENLLFDRVLLVADGDEVRVGTPLVDGATVEAEIVRAEVKARKVRAFKFKRRKGYHRNMGHRQRYTQVRITKIQA